MTKISQNFLTSSREELINLKYPVAIDSFRLRLPYHLIKDKHGILASKVFKVIQIDEDNDIVIPWREGNNFNDYTSLRIDGSIISYIKIKKTIGDSHDQYLIIHISSKVLGSSYFGGINFDNLKDVYNAIIEDNIVYISESDFLHNSLITDIDVKLDYVINSFDEYKDLIKSLKDSVPKSSQYEKGYKLYEKESNYGIEMSNRKTSKFKTNPYLKIYWKKGEMGTKSRTFTESHNLFSEAKNRFRIETTIKNKKHLNSFGFDGQTNSLWNVAAFIKENGFKFILKALQIHFEEKVVFRSVKPKEKLNPNETIIWTLISELKENDPRLDYNMLIQMCVQHIECKVSKSRAKKRITALIKFATDDFSDNQYKAYQKRWLDLIYPKE